MKGIICRDLKSFTQHHLWMTFIRGLADCLDLLAPDQTTHFFCSITSSWSIQRIFPEYKLAFFPPLSFKQSSLPPPQSTVKQINLHFLLYLFAFNKMLQSDALVDTKLTHSNLLSNICMFPSRRQNINILPGTHLLRTMAAWEYMATQEYKPLHIITTQHRGSCSIQL